MSNKINRIEQTFADLKSSDKTAFVAFITAGDVPSNPVPQTVAIMHGLVKGGSDILELGVPFSDPSADGPTIQQSNERALSHNISLSDVFEMVRLFRTTDDKTPVVLMGYLNPIENMGYANFVQSAQSAGVDGLITVDLPPEEAYKFNGLLSKANIAPIYLITPTSTETRIKLICESARGFVYYVSVKGVTGQKEPNYKEVSQKVNLIKQLTDFPVCVGFGIKDRKAVQAVSETADAVVVGSAIVNQLKESDGDAEQVAEFVARLKG